MLGFVYKLFLLSGWKMFYCHPYERYSVKKGTSWLSVLNVEKKSVLLRRLGKWLVDQIRVEREQN
jgi:hypothetical protein